MWINRGILILVLALLTGSGGAYAFREVTPASQEAEKEIKEQKESQAPGKNGSKFDGPKDDSVSSIKPSKNNNGIELVIPGIGKVGTLPRLDFGLELLYGANDEKAEEEETEADSLTIKGSVKHKF